MTLLRLAPLWMVLLLATAPCDAWGQNRPGEMRTDGSSYHMFARPGQNTIQVLVLGDVGQPGMYEIGEGLDLAQLLALSGGPGLQRSARNRSETTLRLYRPQDGQRELIFEAEMEGFMREREAYPSLRQGDVFQVETVERERFGWRDALRILTAAATVTFSIERLLN